MSPFEAERRIRKETEHRMEGAAPDVVARAVADALLTRRLEQRRAMSEQTSVYGDHIAHQNFENL